MTSMMSGLDDVRDGSSERSFEAVLGDEQRRLLALWNATDVAFPDDVCLHGLVDAQAMLVPDALAVGDGDRQITYGELVERSNRVACFLQGLGVVPDMPVAVCVGRSVELIVALLGVLKAGGAYVPLDPEYPPDRLAFMVADAQARVVLMRGVLGDLFPVGDATVVVLDEVLARGPVFGLRERAVPEHLAYVIYTSGSTGRPKGVAITHRSVVHLMMWHRRVFGVGAGDRATQVASPSFDAAVWEVWPYLFSGASVHVLPDAVRVSPVDVRDWLRVHAITVSFVPTPIADRLLTLDWGGSWGLRFLLTGGDRLQRSPGLSLPFVLVNNYGPTENTVVTTSGVVASDGGGQVVPSIGRPIDNTRVFLLDDRGERVPIGVPGELFVGGVGLARGYLNRPDLTAERFVPNPFGMEGEVGGGARSGFLAGAHWLRLYRTGDLARFLADGSIEFLGRIDQQVKVRGFRIELGEVEAVLVQHVAVGEVAVLARAVPQGDNQLVAFVVVRDGCEVGVAGLRSFVKARLPDYMVPAVVVFLAGLPLTPNGKVDRRALSEVAVVGQRRDYCGPRTPVESVVHAIWAEAFGVEQVDIFEQFFDLGGHSLIATHIIARLRQSFQVDVSIRMLFDAPSIAGFAAVIMRLLGTQQRREVSAIPVVVQGSAGGMVDVPVSFAQERLWFLDRFVPESGAYHVPIVLRFSGVFDRGVFQVALSALTTRHAVLRTVFPDVQGVPVQRVLEGVFVPVVVVDACGLDAGGQEVLTRGWFSDEFRRPFSLRDGPLLRGVLVCCGPMEHVFLLCIHHIVFDGWSVDIFLRELLALYEAVRVGGDWSQVLPALPFQYADFAVWQREQVAGSEVAEQLAYWRGQLAGVPALLALPTRGVRPAVQTDQGDTVVVAVGAEVVEGVRALGRQEDSTLFMTLLSVFMVLLSRYTGQSDVVVGVPIGGRMRVELEGLIGFFVNTLAIRVEVPGGVRFRELLQRVRDVALSAYACQDVPFERLVEVLQPVRDLSYAPLVQVMFHIEPAAPAVLVSEGLRVSRMGFDTGRSRFDLSLVVREVPDGLMMEFEYRTELFERWMVVQMAGVFQRLLAAVVADPGGVVGCLPLLSDVGVGEVLMGGWGAGGAVVRGGEGVHGVVALQVVRRPDAVAVVCGVACVTYAELDARAGRLARFLVGRGVSDEARVGIAMGRSVEVVVSMLGVLKAGAAFVGLDVGWGAQGWGEVLADAGVVMVLTVRALVGRLPVPFSDVVCVDGDGGFFCSGAGGQGVQGVDGLRLACVVYEGVAVGEVRGVACSHGGLLSGFADEVGVLADDGGGCWWSDVCAAGAVYEVFAVLTSGATVYVVPEEVRGGREGVFDWVVAQGVGCAFLPAALVGEAVRWAMVPRVGGVRRVMFSGGPVSEGLLVDVGRGGVGVGAMWGCAEVSMVALRSEVFLHAGVAQRAVLGRPVQGVVVYVLDGGMRPVPMGVPGVLYVGGAGLARGYFGRPGETAERFVPSPFGVDGEGARLYRTGVLVCWRGDGRLEFLGRVDDRLLMGGAPVEAEAIVARLVRHPAVREGVVVVRDGCVIGYVVPFANVQPSGGELHAWLDGVVPSYMMPSSFVWLSQLPRRADGSVVVQGLPLPGDGEVGVGTRVVFQSFEEELLAGIWADVLGVAPGGGGAHFFDLGGHSLQATQVVARVRDVFGVEVPVRMVFEVPTLRGLAAELVRLRQQGVGRVEVPVVRGVHAPGGVPLSLDQERLWFIQQMNLQSTAYSIFVVLTVVGVVDYEVLAQAVQAVVARHEVLRTSFVLVNGVPMQSVFVERPAPLVFTDLRGVPGEERATVADERVRALIGQPFDLQADALLRVEVMRLEVALYRLVMTIHHCVADGQSLALLLREVMLVYQAGRAGAADPAGVLPPLPLQYADFALWQRQWLQGDAVDGHVAYWRGQLAGAPPVVTLPLSRPRPAQQSFRGGLVPVAFGFDVTEALRGLGRREGTTLFMTVFAAFVVVLARGTGQEDVVVGVPAGGRLRREFEPLVGMFVNALPIRVRLGGDPTFRMVLAQVRMALLDAYDHQELPFLRLVEALALDRVGAVSPVFQVMFDVRRDPLAGMFFPDGRVQEEVFDPGTAILDLTFDLVDTPLGLTGVVEYATDIFDAPLIADVLRDFRAVLGVVARMPGARLSELPVERWGGAVAQVDQVVPTGQEQRSAEDESSAKRARQEQIAARRAQLSRSQQALIEKRLQRTGARTQHIERCDEPWPRPLSFAQERLWFLDRLDPQSTAYLVAVAKRVVGVLSPSVLGRVLAAIVGRHEILRMGFFEQDGRPVQAVVAGVRVPLVVYDVSGLVGMEQEVAVDGVVRGALRCPFSLAHPPLVRVVVVQQAPQEQVLLLVIHHIVFDGWSAEVLLREIAELYVAAAQGDAGFASRLPVLPIQYSDYAVWQRRVLVGEVLAGRLAYWQGRLAGAPPTLDVPTDFTRPPVQTFRGGIERLRIGSELAGQLRALANREGATLFMTLLAGFLVLLARYSGQEDVVVGTPVAGRHVPETEPLIGMFVNTLALRMDLRGNPSFLALLGRVREGALGDYAHQDLPFERLVEVLHPVRDLSVSPLFQVMFILQNVPEAERTESALQVRAFDLPVTASQFDMTLMLHESGGEIAGGLIYNADLFAATSMARMGGHLLEVLSAIVADPQQGIGSLALVGAEERRRLVVDWNVQGVEPDVACGLHALVEAQVGRTPLATAVVWGEERVTYAALDAQATEVARCLQGVGVGAGVFVGLYVERSVAMVVAILGVLKAGGAYVPLDIGAPAERIGFILRDAQVGVVVTQRALVSALPVREEVVVCVDALPSVEGGGMLRPPVGGVVDQVAYVIYTSGSTGQPKGVMITHANVVTFLRWCLGVFSLADVAATLAATSVCFDLSIFELFVPLSCGGCVVLVENLLQWSDLSVPVTLVNTVPSVLSEFLRRRRLPSSVRVVNLAGEALPRALVDQVYAYGSVVDVYNLYGPSEDTTYSTYARMPERGDEVPRIGRPIDHTRAFVLDGAFQLVPVGVPGELFLGGAGLARGYVHRPDLTAERFVPDAFCVRPGSRLYRTGDRVRYDDAGNLVFLGRLDHQVKVHGFRIELGEIEIRLAQHGAVQECAVVVRADGHGGQQIVGYVALRGAGGVTGAELRGYLRAQVPEYMVPAQVVVVAALPRTVSGKVDRRALPAVERTAVSGLVPPRDALEAQLVEVWESLLPTRPIGVTDNFFDVGGHSFLTIQLMEQIRQRFHQVLPIATLFQGGTIEALAVVLRQGGEQSVESPLVGMQVGGTRRPLFCVHPIAGQVVGYAHLVRLLGEDQPVYGLEAVGLRGGEGADDRVEVMAARYRAAIQEVQPTGPYALGGWSFGAVVAFELARQLREQGEEVSLLALIDRPVADREEYPDDPYVLGGWFLRDLARSMGYDGEVAWDGLQQQPAEGVYEWVIARVRAMGVLPDSGAVFVRRVLDVFLANVRALRGYVPQGYDGDVTLFCTDDLLAQGEGDVTLGWGAATSGEVRVFRFAGDHFSIMRPPYVQVLAERLRACLWDA